MKRLKITFSGEVGVRKLNGNSFFLNIMIVSVCEGLEGIRLKRKSQQP